VSGTATINFKRLTETPKRQTISNLDYSSEIFSLGFDMLKRKAAFIQLFAQPTWKIIAVVS
jgi:hypothetical protein